MSLNILITNDDGYKSEGLMILAKWAKKLGKVTVAAPKTEQSGKSHSIEIHKPYEAKKVEMEEGIEWYYVDSTPADCIRFGFNGLNRKYDLVLSGINRGLNLGEDISYSGTVGAIFEASYMGVNALAFSTEEESFEAAKNNLDKIYNFILSNDLFKYNDIYNINIPLIPQDEILVTKQGGPFFKDRFHLLENGLYKVEGYSVYKGAQNFEEDLDATLNGYISVSPLTASSSCETAFEKIKHLNSKRKN
jgi:5'-nucleotidase